MKTIRNNSKQDWKNQTEIEKNWKTVRRKIVRKEKSVWPSAVATQRSHRPTLTMYRRIIIVARKTLTSVYRPIVRNNDTRRLACSSSGWSRSSSSCCQSGQRVSCELLTFETGVHQPRLRWTAGLPFYSAMFLTTFHETNRPDLQFAGSTKLLWRCRESIRFSAVARRSHFRASNRSRARLRVSRVKVTWPWFPAEPKIRLLIIIMTILEARKFFTSTEKLQTQSFIFFT